MKFRIFKLLLLIILLLPFQMGSTNSYLFDSETSAGNMMTAGCWTVYAPALSSPTNNYVANAVSPWYPTSVFSWNGSWVCPGRNASYQLEIYSDVGLSTLVYRSDWISETSIAHPGLADGNFYWRVQARDNSGNTSSWSTAWKLVVDRTAPDTTITGVTGNAVFTFVSSEANSTFKCKLDSGSFEDCTSPKTYSGLSDGAHTFYVVAIDQAGNVDPSPAEYPWTVSNSYTPIVGDIVLNEFLPHPSGGDNASMPGGEWIELYNNSVHDIDVNGWVIYDSNNAHDLPISTSNSDNNRNTSDGGETIVRSHSFLVVYRNGHGPFNMNNTGGDTVRLYNGTIGSGATLMDSHVYTLDPVPTDKSFARIPDGTGSWVDPIPTPGEPNKLAETVTPMLDMSTDEKNVSFKVSNLDGFSKLAYTLTYDSDQSPQGVSGTSDLNGAKEYNKDGITLGTCSTGGTCTYNTGVKNIHLKVDLTDKDNKVTTLEKSI